MTSRLQAAPAPIRALASPFSLKPALLEEITAALAPHGLNLIGTTPVAAYETLVPAQYQVAALLPQAKTVVVIGNGGGAFWAGFRAYCDARPGYLQERAHPLDDYTVAVIERTLAPCLERSGARYRFLYPFRFATEDAEVVDVTRISDHGSG